MGSLVATIIEHRHGRIASVSYEAAAAAVNLAGIIGSETVCIAIGEDTFEMAGDFAKASGLSCLTVNVPGLTSYDSDAYKLAVSHAVKAIGAKWVIVAGTTQGLDYAPGVAVRIGGACLSNVQGIFPAESGPVFVRPMLGGKVLAELTVQAPAVIITQPGRFRYDKFTAGRNPEVTVTNMDQVPTGIRTLEVSEGEHSDSSLTEASVVVCAGRGIGKAENLERIRMMAELFSRSSIAGSRPICDDGWLPCRLQVGQTGATVTPDLYVACGISGAQQHLAGMSGSRFVVAINTDPEAPIFHEADIGIVEDVELFLDCFREIVLKDRSGA